MRISIAKLWSLAATITIASICLRSAPAHATYDEEKCCRPAHEGNPLPPGSSTTACGASATCSGTHSTTAVAGACESNQPRGCNDYAGLVPITTHTYSCDSGDCTNWIWIGTEWHPVPGQKCDWVLTSSPQQNVVQCSAGPGGVCNP